MVNLEIILLLFNPLCRNQISRETYFIYMKITGDYCFQIDLKGNHFECNISGQSLQLNQEGLLTDFKFENRKSGKEFEVQSNRTFGIFAIL